MNTYYCPRGCNVFDTNQTEPECGACGQRMSLDDTAFYDSIEAIEDEGIAAVERDIRSRQLSAAAVRQCSGSAHWHRHRLNPDVRYTDGAKHIAQVGAYWLLDSIALAQLCDRRVAAAEFQVWKLAVHYDRSALLTCEDNSYRVVFRYRMSHSDFPKPGVTLWFSNGVIFLPNEY
jgi:hypothetical protein